MKISHNKKVASKKKRVINHSGKEKNNHSAISPRMIVNDISLSSLADMVTVGTLAKDLFVGALGYYLAKSNKKNLLEVKCQYTTPLGTRCKEKANIIQGEFNGIVQQLIQCTVIKSHVKPLTDPRKIRRLGNIHKYKKSK